MVTVEELLNAIRVRQEQDDRMKARAGLTFDFVPVPFGPGVSQLKDLMQILPSFSYTTGPWIAGGSCRRLLQGLSLDNGDVDVFFYSKKQWVDFHDALKHFEVVYTSENAITFLVHGIKVQIIKRKFYESLGAVFEDFDFTVCQIGCDGNQLIVTPEAHKDITNNVLNLADKGRYCNMTLMSRFTKYVNYGFIPVKGLYVKVVKSALNKSSVYEIFDESKGGRRLDDDAWYNGEDNKDLIDPIAGVTATVSRGTAVLYGVSHDHGPI